MKSPEGGPPIFRLNSYYKGGKIFPDEDSIACPKNTPAL